MKADTNNPISDTTFNPDAPIKDNKNYVIRKAARGILLKDKKIAWLHVFTRGFHKLPGGGMEANETTEQAFKREVLEETGYECNILDEGPITLEQRDKFKLLQTSYVFMAEVVGTPVGPTLEQGEIDEGHDLQWFTIEETEKLLHEENPTDYESKFIHLRDKSIFAYYKEKLNGDSVSTIGSEPLILNKHE